MNAQRSLILTGDLTGDLENFPVIKKECTEDCKKMMIEIVEKTLRDFTTIATNYFKDAKIGIKRKDECDEDVEKAMNVKRINGKVVHLNNQENDNKLESSTNK
ncbi:hypothetical protein DDB_G0284797 [Dictyostelium discoideum AX4]|uniref:Uncharacterized protein n=1 Tax=Dictyostelium discoideum TaxID=44689 RepID=Q54P48_DICDI|nr:hypothetical protein DDB_G0284797 [Dictyostelium discoideum AX4]EAL65051.1 hypothetical protein DDB_G0284797 [Dictyostelium discoideum AX4]|eukprot:XP_638410.1 hypothetical protein DDB_G0284797 [Dictyostelium discoideum AX4]